MSNLIEDTAAKVAAYMLDTIEMSQAERERGLTELFAGLSDAEAEAVIAEADAMLRRTADEAATATKEVLKLMAMVGDPPTEAKN